MTQIRTNVVDPARGQRRAATARGKAPRLYRLDGGYVVLHEAPSCADAFASIAAEWTDHHLIAIAHAADTTTESELAELGRAAQTFDRIVICESRDAAAADSAARFARAVRRAGRTECAVVADSHRALRHCIDGMIPGDVIAYCCEDADAAARILAEYGALPLRDDAGTHVAPGGVTGESTAAHA